MLSDHEEELFQSITGDLKAQGVGRQAKDTRVAPKKRGLVGVLGVLLGLVWCIATLSVSPFVSFAGFLVAVLGGTLLTDHTTRILGSTRSADAGFKGRSQRFPKAR